MKKIKWFAVMSAVICSFIFSSCSSSETNRFDDLKNNIDTNYYQKYSDRNITLNVANWGEYMSVNSNDSIDVNKAFEEITGIKINYKTCATNEELYAKLKSGGADYDVIIPSDYMISRMIEEKMIQPIDFENIPNYKYISDRFRNTGYDKENKYSVPYMWGIVCIIYNTDMVDEKIDSWDALWNEKYEGNILMFNNPRDAFGIALLRNGNSINTENKDELKAAAEELKIQKKVVKAYVMDEIFDKMGSGSAAIAPYYAGDAVIMMNENSSLEYAIPKEGTNQFVDACCITADSKKREIAEMYINFLNEPEIAAANCEFVGYSTPNTAAFSLLDEETKNNPLQYPDEDYLNSYTEFFINLSSETNAYVQYLWNDIKITSSGASAWFIPTLLTAMIIFSVFINIRRARKKKQDTL